MVDSGVTSNLLLDPLPLLLLACGESIGESVAVEPCRGICRGRCCSLRNRWSRVCAKSSSFEPCRSFLDHCGGCSSLSVRVRASYKLPTWARYGLKTDGSTCGMFVSVTGGISLVLGGLCAEEAGADVCGRRPVLTMGGCSSVEMAVP
jgi:hypothetical protein